VPWQVSHSGRKLGLFVEARNLDDELHDLPRG
jgi:hypothetical protein